RQQGQLETIRRSGDDLLFLINDILDLSKIEAGKLDMERRSFEPDKEITSVVELYAARAQAKGIDLRLERRGQLPDALLGDSTRLRQIVSNLVSNALKFTESGSVVVGVEAVLDPAVTPVTAILQCDVSDTGIGIPADRVDLLFQPFTQGDSATTRRFGGTGLGLSICARLCEAMSGQISVVSKPGEGSRFSFTVRLPVAEKPTRAQAEPVECSAPNFAGARVLVVEDLEANRAVIKGMLARCGIACDEARDGLEGLERFRSSDPYDLIMMDIQMPRMDGLEAAQKIRAHEAAHGVGRTCVIALTAGVFHEERERYQAAGMDGLLAKPVKLSALRDCLQRWLTPRDRSVAS
ncbi:MAG: ATP-binding protein, partial [Quisquiliibacterium sp.]